MPLGKNVRYRVKRTPKGNVRLAFKGGDVVETKNLATGRVHSSAEFEKDRAKNRAPRGLERLLGGRQDGDQ